MNSTTTPGAVAFLVDQANQIGTGFTVSSGAASFFSGFQYSGVVVYDARNTQSHCWASCMDTVTGGAGTSLIGYVYAPSSDVKLTGGSGGTVVGEVVGYEVEITGGSGTAVTSDNRYQASVTGGLVR